MAIMVWSYSQQQSSIPHTWMRVSMTWVTLLTSRISDSSVCVLLSLTENPTRFCEAREGLKSGGRGGKHLGSLLQIYGVCSYPLQQWITLIKIGNSCYKGYMWLCDMLDNQYSKKRHVTNSLQRQQVCMLNIQVDLRHQRSRKIRKLLKGQ